MPRKGPRGRGADLPGEAGLGHQAAGRLAASTRPELRLELLSKQPATLCRAGRKPGTRHGRRGCARGVWAPRGRGPRSAGCAEGSGARGGPSVQTPAAGGSCCGYTGPWFRCQEACRPVISNLRLRGCREITAVACGSGGLGCIACCLHSHCSPLGVRCRNSSSLHPPSLTIIRNASSTWV